MFGIDDHENLIEAGEVFEFFLPDDVAAARAAAPRGKIRALCSVRPYRFNIYTLHYCILGRCLIDVHFTHSLHAYIQVRAR